MSETRFGSTKNIKIALSENDLIWLVQMMALIKVNAQCVHCGDEAVEKLHIFVGALSPEAGECALELADGAVRAVMEMKGNDPRLHTVN